MTVISLGLTKRNKPVLPARMPATSLDKSDAECHSNSYVDEEVHKIKSRLDTLFRPCDCGGPGWKKIAFYNFSQQECPPEFTTNHNVSCRAKTKNRRYDICTRPRVYSSSLSLPVEARSYSSVCGRVEGVHVGWAFFNAIFCRYSLEQPYVSGMSLTHGPAGRRRHIWTFAAAYGEGHPYTPSNCGCSNTKINWPHATPYFVGQDYFCDSYKGGSDVLWDGERCGPSSTCCELNDPPYFCKHLHYTTSEDLEIRLFSEYNYPSVSLIEIFVK